MIQTVLKRDGRVVGFNEEKIATAIRKAMLHTDKGEDLQLIHQITDRISFKGDSQMTVEAIQDLVEVELMKSSRKDVAQKYIAYRNQRSIARKDARHVPGNHQHQVQRHHTRKCQHECRYPGGHDDEVCQRNHQAFCGRLSAE